MNLGLSANIQRMVVADSVENPRQLLVTKVQIVQALHLFGSHSIQKADKRVGEQAKDPLPLQTRAYLLPKEKDIV